MLVPVATLAEAKAHFQGANTTNYITIHPTAVAHGKHLGLTHGTTCVGIAKAVPNIASGLASMPARPPLSIGGV